MAKPAHPSSAPPTPNRDAPKRVIRIPKGADKQAVLAAACPKAAEEIVTRAPRGARLAEILADLRAATSGGDSQAGGSSGSMPMAIHPRGRRAG